MKTMLLMMAMILLLPCNTLMTQSSSPRHTIVTQPAPIPTGRLPLTIVSLYCPLLVVKSCTVCDEAATMRVLWLELKIRSRRKQLARDCG